MNFKKLHRLYSKYKKRRETSSSNQNSEHEAGENGGSVNLTPLKSVMEYVTETVQLYIRLSLASQADDQGDYTRNHVTPAQTRRAASPQLATRVTLY